MHTSYTVGVTTGEYKALQSVMIDQQEWVSNAIRSRAQVRLVKSPKNMLILKLQEMKQ